MMDPVIHGEAAHIIIYLNRQRNRFMSGKLGPAGLSGPSHYLITGISRDPGTSQDALAEKYMLDKGNVARWAKQLEQAGYIIRKISTTDRRLYQLFLTERGEEAAAYIKKCVHEWGDLISRGFTDEEYTAAVDILRRMEENSR